jgi:hypothetical protein
MTLEQNPDFALALKRLRQSTRDEQAWQTVFACSWPTAVATAARIFRGVVDLAEDSAQRAFARVLQYGDFENLKS